MIFTHLSPRRKALRGLGVTLAILGGITVLYVVFVQQPLYWYYDPGPGVEGTRGEMPLIQSIVGIVGIVLIFLGYQTYRFIPYSERDL